MSIFNEVEIKLASIKKVLSYNWKEVNKPTEFLEYLFLDEDVLAIHLKELMKAQEFKGFVTKFKALFNIDLNKVYSEQIKQCMDNEMKNLILYETNITHLNAYIKELSTLTAPAFVKKQLDNYIQAFNQFLSQFEL